MLERLERHGAQVPLLLALMALALRLWHLDFDSIWLDEAMTAYHSSLPASDLWRQPVTNKPPLYYHITALFWSPGDGAFALRLPAALFGAATVFLSWYLGKALAGIRGAFALALLMSFSGLNIEYSQEARNYTLLTLGWLLIVWSSLRLLDAAHLPQLPARPLAGLGLGVLVMVQCHPIAIHYVVAAAASYLIALAAAGQLRAGNLRAPAAVAIVAGLTLAPWFPVLKRLLSTGQDDFNWLEQPGLEDAWADFVQLFGGEPVLVFLALAGLALYAWRGHGAAAILLFGLLSLPPLLIWATGLVKPVYMLRTIMPGHVVALAGLALFITAPARSWWVGLATVGTVGWLAWSSWEHLSRPHKDDWRELSTRWQAGAAPQDVMWLCQKYWYHPVHFYIGEDMPPAYVADRKPPGRLRAVDVSAARGARCTRRACEPYTYERLPGLPRVVWVVDGNGGAACPAADVSADLKALTGADYSPGGEWRGRNVVLTPFALNGRSGD